MEKCSNLVFDLTATEVVYVSRTSPDGETADWGNLTTLEIWPESGGSRVSVYTWSQQA